MPRPRRGDLPSPPPFPVPVLPASTRWSGPLRASRPPIYVLLLPCVLLYVILAVTVPFPALLTMVFARSHPSQPVGPADVPPRPFATRSVTPASKVPIPILILTTPSHDNDNNKNNNDNDNDNDDHHHHHHHHHHPYRRPTRRLAQYATFLDATSFVSWGELNGSPTSATPALTAPSLYRWACGLRVCAAVSGISSGPRPGTAWGDPSGGGTATLPDDLSLLAIGNDAFVAVRADGSLAGWGDPANGATVPPGPSSGSPAIALEAYRDATAFATLHADGTVLAWGLPANGGSDPGISDGRLLITNAFAMCVVRADGSVHAWGNTAYGGDPAAAATALGAQGIYPALVPLTPPPAPQPSNRTADNEGTSVVHGGVVVHHADVTLAATERAFAVLSQGAVRAWVAVPTAGPFRADWNRRWRPGWTR